jgi:hypothetical protein
LGVAADPNILAADVTDVGDVPGTFGDIPTVNSMKEEINNI